MKNAHKLKAALPKLIDYRFNKETNELDEVEVEVPAFINDEGTLVVRTEHNVITGDYYGEFNGGAPYIVPALVEFAKAHGMMWEWVNPGSFALYE